MSIDKEYKRMCWASRRGMLELDLILVPFVENFFLQLDEKNKQSYQQLMECEDTDLFSWFLGKTEPKDRELYDIVEKIRASKS